MRRHPLRWAAGAAVLALAPKCVLCALAYLGFGAAALGRVEMCGAPGNSVSLHPMLAWLGVLASALVVLLTLGILAAKNAKSAEKSSGSDL